MTTKEQYWFRRRTRSQPPVSLIHYWIFTTCFSGGGHCCFAKMSWNAKRSLFRTHLIGVLSLVFLLLCFCFSIIMTWLRWELDSRKPVTPHFPWISFYKRDEPQLSSEHLERNCPQTLRPQTATSPNNTDLSLQRVTGLENTLEIANGSIWQKGTGHPNAYHFKYIINEPEKCQEEKPLFNTTNRCGTWTNRS